MKILVTGASGFVGSHLCERLLREGHEVFALVRTPKKLRDHLGASDHPKLSIIQGDLNQKELYWVTALPDDLGACVHTAGLVHTYNTDDFFKVNTEGTQFLVSNLKKRFHSLHFVLISSLAAAGPALLGEKKNESDLDFPVSLYGRSKKEAENTLRANAPETWNLSIIRPPMVIGPRDNAVLDIFKMIQGGVVLLAGKNAKGRAYSFVCVFDLVETITKIIELKKTGLFYSSHPQVITFLELVNEIKKQLKKKWIFFLPLPLFLVRLISILLGVLYRFVNHSQRLTPDKYHEIAPLSWTCEGTKTENELSQVYHYDISRTITVTLLDYKERKWI